MQTTTVNGIEIGFEIIGGGSPTVVFLNGVGMTMAHWKPVIQYMNDRSLSFLLHDFRGQLMSGKPDTPYTLEMHARDLALLMDHCGIASAVIAGTSYGSEVGLEFAMKYPGRCESLVVIDGVSELDPVLKSAVESWIAAARVSPGVFYRSLLPWNYSNRYLSENLSKLRERESAVSALPPEYFRGFIRLCEAFLEINLTSRLNQVECPTLVVVGEYDILKHRRFAEIIHHGISGSHLEVVDDAGHAVVIEKPREIAELILGFIQ